MLSPGSSYRYSESAKHSFASEQLNGYVRLPEISVPPSNVEMWLVVASRPRVCENAGFRLYQC